MKLSLHCSLSPPPFFFLKKLRAFLGSWSYRVPKYSFTHINNKKKKVYEIGGLMKRRNSNNAEMSLGNLW